MCIPFTRTSLFYFSDTATPQIYTLSLHDALPILGPDETASNRLDAVFEVTDRMWLGPTLPADEHASPDGRVMEILDRKSTRLNSSHLVISYAVFCLKKKKSPTNNVHSTRRA